MYKDSGVAPPIKVITGRGLHRNEHGAATFFSSTDPRKKGVMRERIEDLLLSLDPPLTPADGVREPRRQNWGENQGVILIHSATMTNWCHDGARDPIDHD